MILTARLDHLKALLKVWTWFRLAVYYQQADFKFVVYNLKLGRLICFIVDFAQESVLVRVLFWQPTGA